MVPVLVARYRAVEDLPGHPDQPGVGLYRAMPVSTRGMAGPPEMTPEASQCYIGLFTQLSTIASCKDFITTKTSRRTFRPAMRIDRGWRTARPL